MTDDLLTRDEHKAIKMTSDLWRHINEKVMPPQGTDDVGEYDALEIVAHIHAIQHAIMANAAARAYPDRYRKLGARGAWLP